jgi:cytochrome c oxidase subunit 3
MTASMGTLTLSRRAPPIPNGKLGMMLLLGSLTLLFSTFISAYMVLRMSSPAWPPAGTPELRLGLASLNTAILLASAGVAWASSARAGALAVFALGLVFVLLQGVEFQRLYARGLTLQTGAYGAVFYTLISCHALHVLGGLAGWAIAIRQPARAEYARMYWTFVTAVWGVLFSILYIL